MASLKVGNVTYRVARNIDAFKQFAIARKMAPLLASGVGELLPLAIQANAVGLAALGDDSIDRLGSIITPVARELAKLSDDDVRPVIETALGLIDRREDDKAGWVAVWNPEVRRAQFDEINNDLSLMLRLTAMALLESFKGFLPAGLSTLFAGAPL